MLRGDGVPSPFSANRCTVRSAVGLNHAPVLRGGNIDGTTHPGTGGHFPTAAHPGTASQGPAVRGLDPLCAAGSIGGLAQIVGVGPQTVVSGAPNRRAG